MADEAIDPAPRAPPLLASRGALVVAFALLAVGIALGLAQGAASAVLFGLYTDGAIAVLWLGCAWGIGSRLTALLDRSAAPAAIARLTELAVGLGAISLAVFALGTLGLLTRATAWLLVLAGAALAVARLRRRWPAVRRALAEPAGAAWLLLLWTPAFAIALLGTQVVPGLLWGDEPNGYDVVSYHIQLPREWFDAGRIATLHHNVFSFFPLDVEMHALLAMHLRGGPYAGMFLAQVMTGAFALLVPLAGYAIVRETASRLAATACALAIAAVPWFTMLGAITYNEGGLTLYATLAAAHALRGRWSLAGACAGLAAGCKYTGFTAAAAIVPLAALLASLLHPRRAGGATTDDRPSDDPPPAAALAGAVRFALVALLVASPWLVRNAVAAGGNPIFPLALRTLGHAHFDAGQVERFEAAHAATPDQRSPRARLDALWRQVGRDWRYAPLPLGGTRAVPLLALFAIAGAALDHRSRPWLAIAGLNAIVWLCFTHLQGRFLVHAWPCLAIAAFLAGPPLSRLAGPMLALLVVGGVAAHREPLETVTRQESLDSVGLVDLGALWDDDLRGAMNDRGRTITFVGGVQPFLVPVDSARLRYRTAFDLPSDRPPAETYVDPSTPDGDWAIVQFEKAARLARTYSHLPPPPRGWQSLSTARVGEVRAASP